jgi:hypothetical protein
MVSAISGRTRQSDFYERKVNRVLSTEIKEMHAQQKGAQRRALQDDVCTDAAA